jgi:hypothetical protein
MVGGPKSDVVTGTLQRIHASQIKTHNSIRLTLGSHILLGNNRPESKHANESTIGKWFILFLNSLSISFGTLRLPNLRDLGGLCTAYQILYTMYNVSSSDNHHSTSSLYRNYAYAYFAVTIFKRMRAITSLAELPYVRAYATCTPLRGPDRLVYFEYVGPSSSTRAT